MTKTWHFLILLWSFALNSPLNKEFSEHGFSDATKATGPISQQIQQYMIYNSDMLEIELRTIMRKGLH